MSMAVTVPDVGDLTLSITEEIHVKATPEATFEALLEQLGSGMAGAEDKSMPMKIEAWPGGRWYRDLGDGNGHLWAHVQAIKRPALLEFCGPLMMSYAVASNVQYRLSEDQGGTLIKFHHYAVGAIPADYREAMEGGWHTIHERARQRAERQ
jgi:hypothetical protein